MKRIKRLGQYHFITLALMALAAVAVSDNRYSNYDTTHVPSHGPGCRIAVGSMGYVEA
ncbi:hypothetical protein [Cernens ardua]|uniref:hypothetical protein n=1 Tax=Cernens ardua TaxID=3402176 RepID=UPI003F9E4F29